MGLHAKRLCMALLVVCMAIYALENIAAGKRWNGVIILSLSLYVLLFILLVRSYWKQKKAMEREQLLDELLQDDGPR